jgi:hypothetical protein
MMAKKNWFLGISAMALVFALVLAGCGGKGSVTVNVGNIAQKLAKLPGTAADSPATVKLAADNIRTTTWKRVITAVKDAKQYVILDLSACSATDNTITGALDDVASMVNEVPGARKLSDTDMNIIKDNQYIKGIILPKSLTSIGGYTFYDCKSLTSVTIPSSVTSIGDRAFCGCSSLTSVTIPDGVTSIEDYAFYRCKSLTSVTIPGSVTSIGDFAFADCTSLTSVTIPDGVTRIGDFAFRGCKSLTSVTIPDDVTSIGEAAFRNCAGLTAETHNAIRARFGNGVF